MLLYQFGKQGLPFLLVKKFHPRNKGDVKERVDMDGSRSSGFLK